MRRTLRWGSLAALGAVTAALGIYPAQAGSGPAAPALTTPTPTDPLPGATRLPNGWALNPAGTQILTQRAPTGVAVAPDGTAYAVTSGIFEEAVERVDATSLVATPTAVSQAYQGVVADASGNVFVSGGPANVVFHFQAAGPALVDGSRAGVAPALPTGGIPAMAYPGNLALATSPSGAERLFAAGNLSVPAGTAVPGLTAGWTCPDSGPVCSVVTILDGPATASPVTHAVPVGRDAYGLAWRPASSTLYVSNWAEQTAASGATGTVSVVSVAGDGSGSQTEAVPVGLAPTGVALSPNGSTLAVANSGSDSVSLLPLNADGSVNTAGIVTASVALPGEPTGAAGTAPLAVGWSPDGGALLVALAGLDAVEVLNADGSPIMQTVGGVTTPTLIPTGWYPDAMALAPQGSTGAARLLVSNLRGNGSGPGYYGQLQPLVGTTTEGTLSAIDLPAPGAARDQAFSAWTAQAVANDQLAPVYGAGATGPTGSAQSPCPAGVVDVLCPAAGAPALDPHAVHVVQILAENKTFDSYFGDILASLPGANADPSFTEYGQAVTTNQHLLAQAFSLSDNTWNEGAEASDLGHSWITGGETTPYNELTWGQNYDQGLRGGRVGGQYSGEGLQGHPAPGTNAILSNPAVAAEERAMFDPPTRLADQAEAAGLGVRVYSTDLNLNDAVISHGDQLPPGDWGLGSPPSSPVSTDLAFPDTDRANIFLHGQTTSHAWDVLETGTPPPTFGHPWPPTPVDSNPNNPAFTLDDWTAAYKSCISNGGTDPSCQSKMPNYVYMTLSENHTYDVSNVLNPVDPTPQSMVADNDYAIGTILDGLSHSPFWKNTIVVLTEDDNQFTGDHMDIHRTFAITAGGLASRLGVAGKVSDSPASFPSLVKTEELLLGLKPMTMFDWLAAPDHEMVATSAGDAPTYCVVVPPTPFLIGQSATSSDCPPGPSAVGGGTPTAPTLSASELLSGMP